MKPDESAKAFEDFVAAKGFELRTSTPRAGISAMLEFRAQLAGTDCSDDVLLYQWGSYDWGRGKHFELNITRQFIETGLENDDAISQLSLTYKYEPTKKLDALGASNCWEDGPQDFHQFILGSASFMAVADAKPDQVELIHLHV